MALRSAKQTAALPCVVPSGVPSSVSPWAGQELNAETKRCAVARASRGGTMERIISEAEIRSTSVGRIVAPEERARVMVSWLGVVLFWMSW